MKHLFFVKSQIGSLIFAWIFALEANRKISAIFVEAKAV